jgi:hypothetical protein
VNAVQADGLACVVCGADFEVGEPSVPVGFSDTGSQVFACEGCRVPRRPIVALMRTPQGGPQSPAVGEESGPDQPLSVIG